MATAYAALVSLLNTMHQIEIHPLLSTSFNNYPNESLHKKIDLLLDFVENYSDADSCGEVEDLLRRIAVVAHEAEDIIEVRAANRIRAAASTAKGLRISRKLKKVIDRILFSLQSQTFLSSLQRITDDMDSIKDQIMKIEEETGNRQPTSSAPPPTPMVDNHSEADDLVRRTTEADPISDEHSPSLFPDNLQKKVIKTTNMVGFDGYLEQLLDQLTRQPSCRQILPIVGMGGIGKTTLARNAYDNLLTVEHFYVRAWVTVSREFSVSEIILQALSCLGRSTSETDKTYGQLGEELHKILYGRRYLIVLDDVWSVEAWDKIKFFFPENNNGSRIVITTRQSELVGYFGSSALVVGFLDDKNSWELFCEKAFPQQDCPPQLVEIGKKIVVKCKGLPLEIAVVGGFLRKSPRTLEYWEEIAKDKSLILDSGEGNDASGILYLSYKHLPVWLKSCFLYLGLFPEDHRIDVSQLIKLWIAEGFIKSNKDQSLEEVGESYINELVDRNLILVRRLRLNKKLKTCSVHDIVRDLCIRIAKKENFYCVQRGIDGKHHFIVDQRTARFYDPRNLFILLLAYPLPESHTTSLVKPLILDGKTPQPSNSRLLRVLFSNDKLTIDPFREVNLRFFIDASSYYQYEIPPSVSLLWNLQTIIFTGVISITAPCEIWVMPQLRHIKISWLVRLPPPPPSDDVFVLQNLQTLMRVENLILSEEMCKRIPNIKKLGIIYRATAEGPGSYHLQNVGCFGKLETLLFSGVELLRNLEWPSSLKKLTLSDSRLVWSDMGMIGSLPHLQILKLLDNTVVGEDHWNCVEGEFCSLTHLYLHQCDDLTYWIAESSSFPVLETLSLMYLSRLDEIPSAIGEVHTLQKIQMYKCKKSANFSAVKILEEQESFGNLGLQVQIMFYYDYEAKLMQEEIEELDISCQNLRIFTKPLSL